MDEILYEISWQNLMMLASTVPSGDDEKKEKEPEKVTFESLSGLIS